MTTKKKPKQERINPKLIRIFDLIKESAEKMGIPDQMNSRNFQSELLADQLSGLKFEVSFNPGKGLIVRNVSKKITSKNGKKK